MKIFLLLILLATSFSSCDDEDSNDATCDDIILEAKSLESEYGCVNTLYSMNIESSQTFVLITTQDQFDTLVTGTCMPTIDFNTFDLVIGSRGFSNSVKSVTYQLTRDCVTQNQNLAITFNLVATANAPFITYHALIPKLKNEEIVSVTFANYP